MTHLNKSEIETIVKMFEDYELATNEWVGHAFGYGTELVEKMVPIVEKLKTDHFESEEFSLRVKVKNKKSGDEYTFDDTHFQISLQTSPSWFSVFRDNINSMPSQTDKSHRTIAFIQASPENKISELQEWALS